MNLYAYVGNNPLSFGDPFGLCPDSLKVLDGTCKGGLTVDEWQAVEGAANRHLRSEARDRVIRLLYAGKIHGAKLDADTRAEVRFRRPGDVYINRAVWDGRTLIGRTSVFSDHPVDLARTLAHESEHVELLMEFNAIERTILAMYPSITGRQGSWETLAATYGRLSVVP